MQEKYIPIYTFIVRICKDINRWVSCLFHFVLQKPNFSPYCECMWLNCILKVPLLLFINIKRRFKIPLNFKRGTLKMDRYCVFKSQTRRKI